VVGRTRPTGPDRQRAPTTADRPQAGRLGGPAQPTVPELGGPEGPEPTRYGDWEKGGRCTDF
jgi:hypothetical protein